MNLYNILLESFLLKISDTISKKPFYKKVKNWRKINTLTKSELKNLQLDNLSKLLKFTTSNVPFYQKYKLDAFNDIEKYLKELPIIKKNIIKDDLDSFLSTDKSKLLVQKSSGSSGVQSLVYMSHEEQAEKYAIQTLWWEWAGYKFGNSILQTGISPNRGFVKRIKDILLKTTYVEAFTLSEKEVLGILQQLLLKPKDHFAGYASSLYLFAKIAKKHDINGINFKSVFSWGDKMFPEYKEMIETQFQTKVYDTYGASEGFMIASQCKEGNYHIMSPHVYLEILDKDGNDVEDGQLGYVVVTRLDGYSMPLIRYYLGDLAIKDEQSSVCKCGKQFPLLKKIIGRDTDIVYTKSGNYMIVHFFTGIFEHISEIKQFQIIQNNLEGIEILYIPDNSFEEKILYNIENQILSYLNEPFIVTFQEVKNIANTKSGKPKMVHSNLSNKHFNKGIENE